ncbi:MAG TPA: hypothetical protein VGA62_09675, partial [Acidimicrobiia bacterium]
MERAVSLSASNHLAVHVRGKPGGGLTLKIVRVDNDPPVISATATPAPNAAGWNNADVIVRFTCSDLGCGIASCPSPITVTAEGTNQVISGTATDKAGNSASASVTVNIDKTPPTITARQSPAANANGWNNGDVSVTFTCSDALSGIASCPSGTTVSSEGRDQLVPGSAVDAAGNSASASLRVSLDKTPPVITPVVSPTPNAAGWNKTDVTVSFACSDGLSGVVACADPVILTTEGEDQAVSGTAADRAGNPAVVAATVSIDKHAPVVFLTEPLDGTTRRVPSVQVSGLATDDHALASISVNGIPMGTGPSFAGEVPLQLGSQAVVATVEDIAGNVATAGASVAYVKQPVVKITSPANLAAFGLASITVSGTVDDPHAAVVVGIERVPATVSGDSFTATGVHLDEGGNVVTAVATDASGGVGTDSVTVVRDTVAPRVLIDSPVNGAVTAASTITVSGRVNDTVLGTINSGQAHVTVNGIEAVVSNRTFLAEGVALVSAANTITAVATDAVGNADTKTITVNRQDLAALSLVLVSGDGQSAGIGEALAQPLVVKARDAAGQPLAG